MKTKAFVLTLILVLLMLIAAQFKLAAANFLPTTEELPKPDVSPPNPPTIAISSPQNQTYTTKSIRLNYSVIVPSGLIELTKIRYYVDGEEHFANLMPNWTMNLYGLSEGTHRVQVTASCRSFQAYNSSVTVDYYGTHYETSIAYSQEATSSVEVYFTVNYPPSIELLSPENRTNGMADFPLNFVVEEPFSGFAYCIDGHDNVSIAGNSTLTNLPNGEHNVTVYAWDAEGNVGASETLTFTVDKADVFPTPLIASVSGALVAVFAVGGWLFYKRGKAGIKQCHTATTRNQDIP